MSKTDYAWVIQRDDGKFYSTKFTNTMFLENIALATIYPKNWKWKCEFCIKQLNLQNCIPVKVKIEIVGE